MGDAQPRGRMCVAAHRPARRGSDGRAARSMIHGEWGVPRGRPSRKRKCPARGRWWRTLVGSRGTRRGARRHPGHNESSRNCRPGIRRARGCRGAVTPHPGFATDLGRQGGRCALGRYDRSDYRLHLKHGANRGRAPPGRTVQPSVRTPPEQPPERGDDRPDRLRELGSRLLGRAGRSHLGASTSRARARGRRHGRQPRRLVVAKTRRLRRVLKTPTRLAGLQRLRRQTASYTGTRGAAYKVPTTDPSHARERRRGLGLQQRVSMSRWLDAKAMTSVLDGVDSIARRRAARARTFLPVGHGRVSGRTSATKGAARTGRNPASRGNEASGDPGEDGPTTPVYYKETPRQPRSIRSGGRNLRDPRPSNPRRSARERAAGTISRSLRLHRAPVAAEAGIEVLARTAGRRAAGRGVSELTPTPGLRWTRISKMGRRPAGQCACPRPRERPREAQDYGSTYANGSETHNLRAIATRRRRRGAMVFGRRHGPVAMGLRRRARPRQLGPERLVQQPRNLLAGLWMPGPRR